MIVGNGLIANLFQDCDRNDVVFFASGVSNSLETNPQQFEREKQLIKKVLSENEKSLFIYFSTCSIYDSSKAESPYVLHKLNMEHLISKKAEKFLILRVSNAVGKGGNPNLLLNYLFRSIMKGETINVHTKATRNLIDSEDVKNIVRELIDKKEYNKILNVAYLHEMGIPEIIETIENLAGVKSDTRFLESGNNYHIFLDYCKEYFERKNRTNKFEYLENLIKKYYLHS